MNFDMLRQDDDEQPLHERLITLANELRYEASRAKAAQDNALRVERLQKLVSASFNGNHQLKLVAAAMLIAWCKNTSRGPWECKIPIIKAIRQAFGRELGLKETKDFVDAVFALQAEIERDSEQASN